MPDAMNRPMDKSAALDLISMHHPPDLDPPAETHKKFARAPVLTQDSDYTR